jgi:peptidoglycan/LPS O-acetylase OafA/YrhL
MAVQAAETAATPTASASRSEPHALPALDGLRGIAVLLVIWCHLRGFTFDSSTEWLSDFKAASGFIGLYLFFVLSGFLLFLPYARSFLSGNKWPSTRRFYMRRALRILPIFYAALFVLFAVALIAPKSGLVPPIPRAKTLFTLVTLFHDVRPDAWFYVLGTDTPLWSLAIEWQFYLVLPVIALGLRFLYRRVGPKGVIVGVVGLMGYGLIVRGIAAASFYAFGYPNVTQIPGPLGLVLSLLYGMNGKYLELFALGMLASLGYTTVMTRFGDIDRQARQKWAAMTAGKALKVTTVVTAVCLLAALALNLLWLHAAGLIPTPAQAYVGRWPQEASGAWVWSVAGPFALGLCLVGWLVGTLLGPMWFRALWMWRPLRLVGLISYSLYVWHALLQHFVDPFWAKHWGTLVTPSYVIIYLVLLLVVGAVSYRFIERPFLHVRR